MPKGEKEKGIKDDIGQGKIKLDREKYTNGEPPDWQDLRGTRKVMGRQSKCKEQFTCEMWGRRHGLD